MNPTNY